MKKLSNQVDLTASLIIDKDHETVFNYFSNYSNDVHWRKEITKVSLNTKTVHLNSITTETSFLSKRMPVYVSTLQCIELIPYQSITNETTNESSFWAKNTRTVKGLPNKSTHITYRLQFDIDIVKHGLGFRLPKFIVKWHTKRTMNSYLAQLKTIIEQ